MFPNSFTTTDNCTKAAEFLCLLIQKMSFFRCGSWLPRLKKLLPQRICSSPCIFLSSELGADGILATEHLCDWETTRCLYYYLSMERPMVSVLFLMLVLASGILSSLVISGTARLLHHSKQIWKPSFSRSIFLKLIGNYFFCASVTHLCVVGGGEGGTCVRLCVHAHEC